MFLQERQAAGRTHDGKRLPRKGLPSRQTWPQKLAHAALVRRFRGQAHGSGPSAARRILLALILAGCCFGTAATSAESAPKALSEQHLSHLGTLVARYGFDDRSPQLGPPSPWKVPDPFRRAVDPAFVVAVQSLGGKAEIPFALRVTATDSKLTPRMAEPAPVYHWSRGSVYATLEARPYHGRLLRVIVQVKLAQLFDGRTRRSPARFWVRIDGPDPSAVPLVHEDSGDQITAGWREISIDVPVLENAEHVHLGLDVRQGAVDIAEVRVVDLGPSGVAPSLPLVDLEVDRLVLLARLLGYVRYFHPSDAASEADWDAVSIDAVETVLSLDPAAPLAPTLRAIFAPIAPTLVIDGTASSGLADASGFVPGLGVRPEGALQAVRWNHYGLGVWPGDHPYHSERVMIGLSDRVGRTSAAGANGGIRDELRDPAGDEVLDSLYETTLRSGSLEIPVQVPLVLYSGVNGTLPVAEPLPPDVRTFRTKPYGFLPVAEDRTTRLAGAMRLWNVAQNFYPNFDEIDCDWEAVLPWGLREVATAKDRDAYAAALERMLVPLQDGHAGIYPFYDNDSGHLPFQLELIEGDAWVSGVDSARWREQGASVGGAGDPATKAARATSPEDSGHSAQPRVGDRLVAIDGVPVHTLFVSLGDQVSAATAGSHQARTRERLLRGRTGEVRRCTFERGNDATTYTAALELTDTKETMRRVAESRRPRVADLGHGILYLDATRIDEVSFRGTLAALTAARGVVVDSRGYPEELTPRWLEHWLAQPAKSPQWHVPRDRAPDRSARTFTVRDWTINPEAPRITAPTVFLTDADAISRAETYLSIVKDATLGQIVGTRTAGTNGNILPFVLPSGLRVTITGMKVRRQDGGSFHGIGIVPDLIVEPTAAGIQRGRDEVLEAGVDLLRSGF